MIQTLVSERAGRVDGHVTYVELGDVGHVRHLVVAPHAGAGVGIALMQAVAEALRARGIGEWQATARVDDRAQIQLYERLGMTAAHRSTVLRLPSQLALPREPATVLPVLDDDDIERALGLELGRIAMLRKRCELVHLRDASAAPVGFAAFDASGAVQFRVARPTLAAALLDGRRVKQLVIEDDPQTTALLIEHGAKPTLELLHYRGTLQLTRIAC